MSILVIEKDSEGLYRRCLWYLVAAVLASLVGLVYETFSHEVYSAFMLCAFLVPLLGGALPCFLLKGLAKRRMPGRFLFQLYDSGLAALTVGCILQGVLEIYGTTNHLINVYWFAGVGLTVMAIALYAAAGFLMPRQAEERKD